MIDDESIQNGRQILFLFIVNFMHGCSVFKNFLQFLFGSCKYHKAVV